MSSHNLPRVLIVIAVAAVLFAGAGVAAIMLGRTTITSGQQCAGSQCWGYHLDRYKFQKKTTLTFWGSWGLDVTYALPTMHIERNNDDRWLPNARAILLDLRFKPVPDVAVQGDRARVLFDYQRGEGHIASTLPLWRQADLQGSDPGKNWLTDDQFDTEVSRLQP